MPRRSNLDDDRIKELRDAGWSYRRIGDELGVDRHTVRRHLSPAAREKQNARSSRWRKANPLTDAQRARNVEATRRWRAAYPERHKAAVQRWSDEHPGANAARTRAAKLANVNTRFRHVRNRAKQLAAIKGVPFDDVDLELLAERDEWTCWICLGPVDRQIMDRCDPWNMSFDHVIPVSQGGGWTAENLRLAHYGCNILRGSSSIDAASAFAREFMHRLALRSGQQDLRE